VNGSDRQSTGVAYVLTHYPRLAQTFISGEVAELRRQGVDVRTVSMNAAAPTDVASDAARAEQAGTFYIKQAGFAGAAEACVAAWRRSPLGMTRLAFRMLRLGGADVKAAVWNVFYLLEAAMVWRHLRGSSVRHLHAHFGQTPANIAWFTTEIGNLVGDDGRWTWSFTIHGFQDFVNERQTRLDLKAKSASFVVCVSDFTKSQIMRVSDPSVWGRFHVVRCGIDLDAFALRRAHRRRAAFRVLVVGRVSPEKGHGVLLDALLLLRRRGRECVVELVGDGPFLPEVRARAAALGLTDQLDVRGELPPSEVVKRLGEADAFCLPSFAEGLPISIMEAMAVGVPVISTLISGIPELAVNDVTALTVPAGNAEALADAIERLIAEPELAGRLATAARAEVERGYRSGHNVAELAQLFAGVTS
jgi:colanic acid/amylovoran biosynthesis glycosyltransferase